MTVYWIAHVTVTDPERYSGYMALAPAAFAKYGAQFLARGGASQTLEGTAHDRQVVIAFPSMETARACYDSPEYRAARDARDGACIAHVSLVEGVA
ncbi:DUF1330 domain-containing protein [Pseudooceanicola sp. CBS1P-1]|uniref:DUF1330 domain-containing protein n=1 Tax=Pseudooceanicola albus TaxID=2692189 RepID=A0A6L7G1E4_9RHOB|nr:MULTISPECIES: DUF1330 domain-containing protein [Pseudooceanicola]MBT9383668.1 DUF1330 domain-containing protein [Pseudooceanicola endophyticus]MXN17522.1 DUF1330 domain-containing protein [Pseudooceanicola albus]